jgi:hypothetical protein
MADLEVGLNEWIERAYGAKEQPYYNSELMFAPCWCWLTDESSRILVDLVAYLETIDSQWSELTHRCGIDANLPVENQSSQSGTERLDAISRKILRHHFAKDFEVFGYEE